MKKELTLNRVLKEKLRDKEFRKAFEEEDFYVRVAIRIAQLREKNHMSQKELARKLHTSQQAVSRIERGYQNVTIGMLERVADVFHKKPDFRFV